MILSASSRQFLNRLLGYACLSFAVMYGMVFLLETQIISYTHYFYRMSNLFVGAGILLIGVSVLLYPRILRRLPMPKSAFDGRRSRIRIMKGVQFPVVPKYSVPDQTSNMELHLSYRRAHLGNKYPYEIAGEVDVISYRGANGQQPQEQQGAIREQLAENRKPIHFTPDQVEAINRQLAELMERKKPFLKQGYSLKDLAGQLQIPAYQLSAFINLEAGMSFNEMINKRRIGYCQEVIKLGEAEQLNIFGLGGKCGFNNRNTFTIAFKKYTGVTPSEFLRSNSIKLPDLTNFGKSGN
jgi:AraC-like DNA-binding protein